jgi:hypothetical protein
MCVLSAKLLEAQQLTRRVHTDVTNVTSAIRARVPTLWLPAITPAFDNRPCAGWRSGLLSVIDENATATADETSMERLALSWLAAMQQLPPSVSAGAAWTLVATWNDFAESSQLQPSASAGYAVNGPLRITYPVANRRETLQESAPGRCLSSLQPVRLTFDTPFADNSAWRCACAPQAGASAACPRSSVDRLESHGGECLER